MNAKLASQIEKLLNKANSTNHEKAKAALQRAQELMERYASAAMIVPAIEPVG